MIIRYILAIVLSFLVLIGWQHFFGPKPRPPQRGAAPAPAATKDQPGDAAHVDRPQDQPKQGGEAATGRPQRESKTATVDLTAAQLGSTSVDAGDSRMSFVVESAGGRLARVKLPEYGAKAKIDPRMPLPVEQKGEPYTIFWPTAASGILSFQMVGEPIPPDENWTLESGADESGAPEVRISNDVDGVNIRKVVRRGTQLPLQAEGPLPEEGLHHVTVSIELENTSATERRFVYELIGPTGIDSEPTRGGPGTDIYLAYAKWVVGGKTSTDTIAAADVVDRWEQDNVAWVGLSNTYFTGLLYPVVEQPGPSPYVAAAFAENYPDPRGIEELRQQGETEQQALTDAYKNVRTGLRSREVVLAPGASVVHEYGLFLSPRSSEVLEHYSSMNLEAVNDYNFLVRLFIRLLDFLKTIAFNSWGLAIIVLTLIVKLCLHPLNKKSQGNMHRFQKQMQKVKPEMDALKERYQNNRVKQNQELQRLFKEKGINPGQQMGGCLLILLQLPIWFALYSTLGYAFGLRQSSFLYIQDLTQPDRLFHMGIGLFGGTFAFFNLLPLLYVIFTIINQRLQPKPDDPQMRAQYQMMTIMMVFFGFIFYNFPSGFMLYIMTSTLLGIVESKLIKAELKREEEAGPELATGQAASGGTMYPAREDVVEQGQATRGGSGRRSAGAKGKGGRKRRKKRL